MNHKLRTRRGVIALTAIAVAAAFAMLSAASSSHATVGSHAVTPAVGQMGVHPDIVGPFTPKAGTDLFTCQGRPIDGSKGIVCYSPQQIQKAYGYSGLLASGVNGTGKTIVIVDAFGNPYIANDLKLEDKVFGLPDPPSFTQIAPQGAPAYDPTNDDQVGWAGEITLDVEWAHVMAPGAKIILVDGKSDSDVDLYNAEKYAVDHHLGDVMSQSFGENENCVDPSVFGKWQALYHQAAAEGWSVFASSGDSGASQFNCAGTGPVLAPGFPAVDPDVTAVGGTTLAADDAGNYIGETAWTEGLFGITCNPPDTDDVNCSGGGFSTIFSKPLYQQLAIRGSNARGVPDVSYDAAVNGGVLTVCSACNDGTPAVFIFGGTSAGSPQWSALTADADQIAHRDLGNINGTLYGLALVPGLYHLAFNDVTTGNNDVEDLGNAGYNASVGWDPVTGLGTPRAGSLLPALATFGR